MVSLEHRLLRKPNYTQQLKREQLHFFFGPISNRVSTCFIPIDSFWRALHLILLHEFDPRRRSGAISLQTRRREREFSWPWCFGTDLLSNGLSDWVGLKKYLVEHSKNYRTVFNWMKIDRQMSKNWPSQQTTSAEKKCRELLRSKEMTKMLHSFFPTNWGNIYNYLYFRLVHQSKYWWEQSRDDPHHLFSSRGGHGLPPRRAWVTTLRVRVDSPMPHGLEQADHWPHSPTTQWRGPPVNDQTVAHDPGFRTLISTCKWRGACTAFQVSWWWWRSMKTIIRHNQRQFFFCIFDKFFEWNYFVSLTHSQLF